MPKPLISKHLSIDACAHGAVHINLHDANQAVFAVAPVDTATAVRLAQRILAAVDEIRSLQSGQVGHA